MNAFIRYFLAAIAGLALGLWSAYAALRSGSPFDIVRIGAWRLSPHAGSADADPYTRAALERGGEIPLGLGEGLSFLADTDDRGAPLDARCVYAIGPHTPPARYWTLSLVDRDGYPVANAAERYGFRSSELLRAANGDFRIVAASSAQPGDWLPIGAAGKFQLVLRLYDSPLGATSGGVEKSALPSIAMEACS